MKLEIDLPKDCSECVFCEELIYCGLLYGENIYEDGDYDIGRPKFCPFDSKEKWSEIHDGIRIISE